MAIAMQDKKLIKKMNITYLLSFLSNCENLLGGFFWFKLILVSGPAYTCPFNQTLDYTIRANLSNIRKVQQSMQCFSSRHPLTLIAFRPGQYLLVLH